MKAFLRVLAPAYAFFVGLYVIWSWGDAWNSMNERHEFFTRSQFVLFLVTLPTSSLTIRGEHWALPIFPEPYVGVTLLTLAGVIQVALLCALARLTPKRRRDTRDPSSNGL